MYCGYYRFYTVSRPLRPRLHSANTSGRSWNGTASSRTLTEELSRHNTSSSQPPPGEKLQHGTSSSQLPPETQKNTASSAQSPKELPTKESLYSTSPWTQTPKDTLPGDTTPSSLLPTQKHSRWKLFGQSDNIDDAVDHGEAKPNRGELFSNLQGDEAVQKLVEGLNAVGISCHSRSLSEQKATNNKYSKFLTELANYTAFHARERNSATARKILFLCDKKHFCGGLGDRIRGVTYTLLLAMLSRRVFLLDWRDSRLDKGPQTYLEPNMIDWRLTHEDEESIRRQKKSSDCSNTHSIISAGIFSAGDLRTDNTPTQLRSKFDALMEKCFWFTLKSNMLISSLVYGRDLASLQWLKASMKKFGLDKLSQLEIDALIGVAFRYLFQFSPQMREEIQAARHVLRLDGLTYVGIHVRTGFMGSKLVQVENNHPKL